MCMLKRRYGYVSSVFSKTYFGLTCCDVFRHLKTLMHLLGLALFYVCPCGHAPEMGLSMFLTSAHGNLTKCIQFRGGTV